jgi:AraC family transcriptional regulator of adaptative response / DNA-3-methyladenine glycosylase II
MKREAEIREPNLRLALAYRPPLNWKASLGFLARRANPGAERISSGMWVRLVRVDGHTGVIRVREPDPNSARANHDQLLLEVDASLAPALMPLCARVKQLFDLVAEPNAIESHLTRTGFGVIAESARGLRVPGAWDGFELAVRAILGQQVSVAGASTLMGRLTSMYGESVSGSYDGLTHLPPTADRLADAGVAAIRRIGLPEARAATIHRLSVLVARGEISLAADADVGTVMRRLIEIRGIGPWTVEYIAMRALHWPDAFPASDLVLRRAAGNLTTAQLTRLAEAWRPWRSYAAMYLWNRSSN